jgi:putative tricarboxylic transport membrane protein
LPAVYRGTVPRVRRAAAVLQSPATAWLLAALLAIQLLASCAEPGPSLRVMVPNPPGGGYDTTARKLASTWEETGRVEHAEVFNLPGASGLVGLSRLEREAGNEQLLLMMGLGVVGAMAAADDDLAFDDVTPVARILSEPNVILVRSDSPVRSMPGLVRRWRRHPASVRVGGGSLPGGPDHLATYAVSEALGIGTGQVRYRRYDGGGPLLAALVSGEVDVVVSGVLETIDQVRSGAVRPLAVTGRDRLPGVEAPTLRQSGVDVVFENWRGLLAPPGLTDDQRDRLVALVRETLATPQWREAEQRSGWTRDLLVGEEFSTFLEAEVRRTRRLLERATTTRGRRS